MKMGWVTPGEIISQKLAWAVEQTFQGRGFPAGDAGNPDVGKEQGLGFADAGVGGHQILFGKADVGATLQEIGSQSRRDGDG